MCIYQSIVGASLASGKTQDLILQDFSRKTLGARLARQKTLFFWSKMENFHKIVQMRVAKKFSNYFFHVRKTIIQRNTLFSYIKYFL